MNNRVSTLLGLVLAILLPGAALGLPAQDTKTSQEAPPAGVRATGIIRTAQGVAVPGATIRLVELASGRAWLSWTDENGKFEFPGLPAGRYHVEAQQLGFELTAKEIELAAHASALSHRAAPPHRTPRAPSR